MFGGGAAVRHARDGRVVEAHLAERPQQALDEARRLLAVDPAQHRDEVVVGIDPDDVAAPAQREVAALRRRRELPLVGVEPPHQPVERRHRAGLHQLVGPARGQELLAVPRAALRHQQAHQREVARRDHDAAAPMAAARHRDHRLAVDGDRRVAIAVPLPVRRGADRIHDAPLQHRRQRLLEELQQATATAGSRARRCIRRSCPASSVARRVPLGASATGEPDHAVVVDAVFLAEQRALPFAGLGQQMPPGDVLVLLAGEAVIERRSRPALSSRSLISPSPTARPASRARKLLATLKVMSGRADVAPFGQHLAAAIDDAASGRRAASPVPAPRCRGPFRRNRRSSRTGRPASSCSWATWIRRPWRRRSPLSVHSCPQSTLEPAREQA